MLTLIFTPLYPPFPQGPSGPHARTRNGLICMIDGKMIVQAPNPDCVCGGTQPPDCACPDGVTALPSCCCVPIGELGSCVDDEDVCARPCDVPFITDEGECPGQLVCGEEGNSGVSLTACCFEWASAMTATGGFRTEREFNAVDCGGVIGPTRRNFESASFVGTGIFEGNGPLVTVSRTRLSYARFCDVDVFTDWELIFTDSDESIGGIAWSPPSDWYPNVVAVGGTLPVAAGLGALGFDQIKNGALLDGTWGGGGFSGSCTTRAVSFKIYEFFNFVPNPAAGFSYEDASIQLSAVPCASGAAMGAASATDRALRTNEDGARAAVARINAGHPSAGTTISPRRVRGCGNSGLREIANASAEIESERRRPV